MGFAGDIYLGIFYCGEVSDKVLYSVEQEAQHDFLCLLPVFALQFSLHISGTNANFKLLKFLSQWNWQTLDIQRTVVSSITL